LDCGLGQASQRIVAGVPVRRTQANLRIGVGLTESGGGAATLHAPSSGVNRAAAIRQSKSANSPIKRAIIDFYTK